MVDDKPEGTGPAADGGSADTSRRTRTPPTLDLEASRVETSDQGRVDQVHVDQAHVDQAHGDAAHAGPSDAEATFDADGAADKASVDTSSADQSSEPRPARKGASVLVSALAGAAAALLVGCGAWLAGLIGGSNGLQSSMIATLETMAARVARLEAVPSPPPTLKADPALTARLDAMDKSLAMLRVHYDRLSKTIEEIKAAPRGTAVTVATPPDLSAVESRLAQLDAKTQALSAESAQVKESVKETVKEAQARTDAKIDAKIDGTLANIKAAEARPAPPADDIKLRRIIAASSLDLAVRQGDPFASALGTAKQLADDAAVLKPLESFAAAGVPGAAALSRELLALLPQLEPKPEGAPAGAGLLDRLQASAARLVKVRRTDAVEGSDSTAILSRVAAAARRNDVAEAKRELMTMPQPERAKAKPWIDKVDARDAALAASRQFAANAMAALTTSAR